MTSAEKILLGNSVPSPEEEMDDEDKLEEETKLEYAFKTVILSIGKENFESVYKTLKPVIKESGIQKQKDFVVEILEKIKEVYNFEVPINYDFNNIENIDKVYNLLEFLEFNYIEFLTILWKESRANLKKINPMEFIFRNGEAEIMMLVDRIATYYEFSGKFPEFILTFLKNYNKNDFIEFIVNKTNDNKMLIYSNITLGELINKLDKKEK